MSAVAKTTGALLVLLVWPGCYPHKPALARILPTAGRFRVRWAIGKFPK